MPSLINAATPILRLVIVGGYIAGLVLAALGAFLVYLGATGSTEFVFFGQTFKSTNVGIAAIFVGGALIVLLIRRTLRTFDRVVTGESAASATESRNLEVALNALARGIDVIDKMTDQVVPFMTSREPYPKEHRIQIEGASNAIVVRAHDREVKRITARDLADLPSNMLNHIAVYEQSARKNYTRWKELYPKRHSGSTPERNAELDRQLRLVIADMKDDLDGILSFLESAGFRLDDHYQQFRDAIRQSG